MSIQASNSKNLYCAATPKTCPFNLSVSFTETSTSVERNTSSLVIEGYIKPNGTWFDTNYNNTLTLKWYDSKNGWKTVTSANIQDLMSNDAYYVSGTLGVEHNADGTLSGYAQIEWTRHSNNASVIYVPPSGSVATSTTALTTIPRASSISSLSGSEIGEKVIVEISRASDSFTHKVEYKFEGSEWITPVTNATTSASFTPALGMAQYIPNSTSGKLTVRVTTFNGSTQIGSSVTSSCNLSVPSSVVPTCSDISLSMIDNGVPSSWGVYVQGYSQVNASISGSGIYGSSISSYYISGAGKSTNSSSLTSGVLTSSSTYSFSAYVTDSRGRTSSTKSASITVYAYSKPSISLTAHRCDSSGNITSSGTYLKITCNYSYASVNGNNSISRSVSCNGASNTSFSSGTSFVLAANCSVTSMYTVTATISDALGNSATATVLIPTDERIMNVKSNGKGVAFGGFSINDNILDSAWLIHGVIADYYLSNLNNISLRPTTANVKFGDGGIRFFKATGSMTDGKPPTDGHIMHMAWDNDGGYDAQLCISVDDGNIYCRYQNSGVWQSWKKLSSDGHTHDYLPLSGGTLTGTLKVNDVIQAYGYAASSSKASITIDKPNSYVVGIGPDGTNDRIRFGPCKSMSDGTWVDTSTWHNNEFYFQGQITCTKDMICSGIIGANSINCSHGDEINFNSNSGTVYFGWRAGDNGKKVTEYRFLNGDCNSNAKAVLICGDLYAKNVFSNNVRCTTGDRVNHFALGTKTWASNQRYLEITFSDGAYGVDVWSSDKTLKEHIKDTEVRDALDKIGKLKHVAFDWKNNGGHVPLGYIADDVEDILGCLVYEVPQPKDENGETPKPLKHIDVTSVVPLITMGIQELIEEKDLLWNFDNEVADCIISLREEIDNLKETVKTMDSTIDSLKAEINSMKQSIA